jgi:hypothetical protein
MLRRFCVVALALLSAIVWHPVAQACGDKFLSGLRGTYFQRPPSAREPATILLYANPSTPLPQALTRLAALSTLQRAGYRCTSVGDAASFEQALANSPWDLVIVDLADGSALISRPVGNADPFILPIAHNLKGDELSRANRQFVRVFRSPSSSSKFLRAVDEALELKKEARVRSRRAIH